MRTYEIVIKKTVKLQDWARYVATDKSGATYQYEHKPHKECGVGEWCRLDVIHDNMTMLFQSDIVCEDWEDSLVELPPTIKKDTLVRTNNVYLRYATGEFDERGHILCYRNGVTSKTNGERSPIAFMSYEVVEEPE